MGKLFVFGEYTVGDWLSVVGLVVTLIGFAITIYNVMRSRSAAEEAVASVREDIARIDMVAEFSAALQAMSEVKRLHREEAWAVLPDLYADLRRSLISIRRGNSELKEDYIVALQSSIQHFQNFESVVNQALMAKRSPSNVAKFNDIVAEQLDELHGILTEVKSEIGA